MRTPLRRRTTAPAFSPPAILLLALIAFCSGVRTMSAASSSNPAGGRSAPADNLVVNGNFETDADHDGRPDGWDWPSGAVRASSGDNHWLRLNGGHVASGQRIRLNPAWWRLTLSMRMRATGVVRGKEGWMNARLAMAFYDADGKRVGPWPNVFHAVGTTDWMDCRRNYYVPEGAVELRINPANFGDAGSVEFDDIVICVTRLRSQSRGDLPPPPEVPRPWDASAAWRQTSMTRERICLNGLWRFLPVLDDVPRNAPPKAGVGWGWFKTPGLWPPVVEIESERAQEILLPDHRLSKWAGRAFDQAWLRRDVVVPATWTGRRILLRFDLVQTHAAVFIDGQRAGEIWFPGGELDLSGRLSPGRHRLDVLVTARPLSDTMTAFNAPGRTTKTKTYVRLRGLTGDVWLRSEPKDLAVTDVYVRPSVRKHSITFDFGLTRPAESGLRAEIAIRVAAPGTPDPVRRFVWPPALLTTDARGRYVLTAPWSDPKLWDVDSPQNLYTAVLTLYTADGGIVDQTLPVRFGFREFRIEGRRFLLNERPIHLRALLVRNTTESADKACLSSCLETCRRLQQYGFNFLITNNYGFDPGQVGYMNALPEACDRTGMLMSFSLPHPKAFQWKFDDPATAGRYRRFCTWLIRQVQNHPSIVLYASTHNATGYHGDQNPLKIDGKYDPDLAVGKPRRFNRARALMAAEIVREIDPDRPVYHHESGNLGPMHTVNIYLNWAPRQERSDWLEHWQREGVKPVFFVEWGLPHISSWSSYRGPQFIWRCKAFQQIWDSEYAAAIRGESAYEMTPAKVQSLEHEELLWGRGEPFAWSALISVLRRTEENHIEIKAWFASDNWRSHRVRGASAMLPWDQDNLWRRVRATPPRMNPDRWQRLTAPGIVPDRFLAGGDSYLWDTGARDNFEPTPLGRVFLRWNRPLIAWIGGAPENVTEKGHNVRPGERIRKQLIIVNDTRTTQHCRYSWTLGSGAAGGRGRVVVPPGESRYVPLTVRIPHDAPAGSPLVLRAEFAFDGGEQQSDEFTLHVVSVDKPGPPRKRPPSSGRPPRIVVFDPEGETVRLLRRIGIEFGVLRGRTVPDDANVLIVGRRALGLRQPLFDLSRCRPDLRVLLFEQTAEVLRDRFGFRVQQIGLRRVFPRVPDHPVFAGLSPANLVWWRGESTMLPPFIDVPVVETSPPKWNWCGFENTRVWRCGNRGAVTSVVIEKPPVGDWLPLADGGFDLQYTPLLRYIDPNGRMIVFCQLDVTGRTEPDPAAEVLCRNLVEWVATAPAAPSPRRVAVLGKQPKGGDLVAELKLTPDQQHDVWCTNPTGTVLVLLPGAAVDASRLLAAIAGGLHVLCLGMDAADIERLFPGVWTIREQRTPSFLLPAEGDPVWTGVSSADTHWRTFPRIALLERTGAPGNPALRVLRGPEIRSATNNGGQGVVVFCQAAPWMFDAERQSRLRTTVRRNMFLLSRLLANLGVRTGSDAFDALSTPAPVYEVELTEGWCGIADPADVGRKQRWYAPEFDDKAWPAIRVPGTFESQRPELVDYDGLFWYRLRFRLPAAVPRREMMLDLGGIDDESWVWLNGKFLGAVTKESRPEDYWHFPRRYRIAPDNLRFEGENVLAVRVRDTYQTGGIRGRPRLSAPPPWLGRWYVQHPIADDDPYRYYRW